MNLGPVNFMKKNLKTVKFYQSEGDSKYENCLNLFCDFKVLCFGYKMDRS